MGEHTQDPNRGSIQTAEPFMEPEVAKLTAAMNALTERVEALEVAAGRDDRLWLDPRY